jgi:hypothetical protein
LFFFSHTCNVSRTLLGCDQLNVLIVPAAGADVMRHLGLMALFAFDYCRSLQLPMSTPLASPGP